MVAQGSSYRQKPLTSLRHCRVSRACLWIFKIQSEKHRRQWRKSTKFLHEINTTEKAHAPIITCLVEPPSFSKMKIFGFGRSFVAVQLIPESTYVVSVATCRTTRTTFLVFPWQLTKSFSTSTTTDFPAEGMFLYHWRNHLDDIYWIDYLQKYVMLVQKQLASNLSYIGCQHRNVSLNRLQY